MDQKLLDYLDRLKADHPGKSFPSFCEKHSNNVSKKKILAVLQDPGGSSPERTLQCSVYTNDDPTAKRQRNILSKLNIDAENVLFWNFFPFFGLTDKKIVTEDKIIWARELRSLASLLDKLQVIVVSGTQAWDGMRYFEPLLGVSTVWTPHPADRGNSTESLRKLFVDGWEQAKYLSEKN